ncbi:MAG: trehalose-phosphatase [Brevefilum sp.]
MALDFKKFKRTLEKNDRLVLFLDYDGTLADFAKYPDILEPNAEVLKLLNALMACENVTTAIVSGRSLAQLQKLIPIPNLIMAGSYGLEIQLNANRIYYPLNFKKIRPALEELKPVWQGLIENESSFFLEDKGWALAIHARFVDEGIAEEILSQAKIVAETRMDLSVFQVNAGNKFLEVSPHQANKGQCVKFLVNKISAHDATLLYLGDDDKDEQAFDVIHSYGGYAIRVCSNVINNPIEDWRLENPKEARAWIWKLIRGC